MADEEQQNVPQGEPGAGEAAPSGSKQAPAADPGKGAGAASEKTGDTPDPESGRKRGDWKTRYDATALAGIYREFWFLAFLFAFSAFLIGYTACLNPERCPCGPSMRLYLLCAGGGLLGGWMFTAKWLIHAVVSGYWDEDRHIWRYLNPFISASLALVFYAIIRSGLFQVLTTTSVGKPSAAIAVGFLVGYSSDRAIGKLGDIADTLFGTKHGLLDGSKGKGAKPSPDQLPTEPEPTND